MKPEPLNLERIESIILDEMMGDLTFNAMMREIKKQVKSACEFYLKYKDNPLLLVRDWDDCWDTGFEDVFEFIDNFSFWIGKNKKAWKRKKYNEWLFKLAFKDVLEG